MHVLKSLLTRQKLRGFTPEVGRREVQGSNLYPAQSFSLLEFFVAFFESVYRSVNTSYVPLS